MKKNYTLFFTRTTFVLLLMLNFVRGGGQTYVNGDYRTTGSGNWTSDTALPAIWERFNGTTWSSSNSPTFNTSANIYIAKGHTVTGSSFGSSVKINVLDGGNFISQSAATANTVHIYSGGTFEFKSALTISTLFEIEDGGTFIYNYSSNPGSGLNLWNGIEKFHPKSNFIIRNHDTGNNKYFLPTAANFTAYNENGVTAYFGNLIFDASALDIRLTDSNLSSASIYLTAGNLELRPYGASSNNNQNLFYGLGTWIVGGDLVIGNNTTSSVNAKSIVLKASTATGNITINVKGNIDNQSKNTLNLSNNTTSSFNLNLEKNLIIKNLSGLVAISESSANLNFAGNGTTQTIDVANQATASNIIFNVNNGAYAQLINQDFILGTNSKFNVLSGGTLNLGTYALSGTSKFTSAAGSNLITNNTGGLVSAIAVTGTKTFTAGTHYTFNANTSTPFPTTGNFGNPASLTFNNANVTSNITGTLTVSGAVNINGTSIFALKAGSGNNLGLAGAMAIDTGATFDNNGENQIINNGGSIAINGNFITRDIQGFTGTNSAIPSITPTLGNNSTIVYGLLGNQAVTNFEYRNLTLAGSGTKTSSVNSSIGTVTINSGVTLDASTNTFGSNSTNLTMLGDSVFKTGGSGSKPDAGGTYVLDPASTIEFQGTSATKIRVTPSYQNVTISGTNVEVGGKNVIINNVTKINASGKLSIPSSLDNDTSYVLTAKKGLQVTTGGTVTFENNAQLIQDADADNSGNIILVRNASVPSDMYNFWASPVKDQDLKDLYSTSQAKVMILNTATNAYTTISGSAISEVGKGYSIKGSSNNDPHTTTNGNFAVTATFAGEPNNNNKSIALSTQNKRYNLIGNPYPSNLSLDVLYQDNANVLDLGTAISPSTVEPTMYFWDNLHHDSVIQIQNYSGVNYAVYNAVSKTGVSATNGDQTKKPNGWVKPGQGFIVKAKENNNANLTLNFVQGRTDGKKLRDAGVNNTPYYRHTDSTGTTANRFWLKLTTPNDIYNTVAIVYDDRAKDTYDMFDSTLMTTAANDIFYSLSSDNTKLAIQGRKTFTDSDKVALGFKNYVTGMHSIAVAEKEGIFTHDQPIYIYDRVLGTTVDISNTPYSYNSVSGSDESRFEIVYKPDTVLGTSDHSLKGFVVYRDSDNFVVSSSKDLSIVELYDMTGKLVYSAKGRSNKHIIPAATLVSGVYVVKVLTNGDMYTKKIIK